LGAGVIGYAKPNTLGAIYDRLSSYGTEITSGESLEWRYVENNYALSHIYRNPMVGVGLGGDYKPAYRPEVFEGEHRYLHNGYLYLMLKLGVLSLVPLAWLYWVIYRRGHFLLRSEMSDRHRAVTAACLVVISIPLITSLTRPEWMTEGSIATLATLIGLMGSIQALRDTSIQLKAEKPTDSLFH
jgi:O-antigen ligase